MIFQCCGMFSAGGVGRNLEFLDFFEKLCAVLLVTTCFRSEVEGLNAGEEGKRETNNRRLDGELLVELLFRGN